MRWSIRTAPLAQKEAVTPEDLAGIPLILTRRGLIQQEMECWFGPYAQQLQVNATGNLPYNVALLAGAHIGTYLTLKLHYTYEGLRFIPLYPPLESITVLAWKKPRPSLRRPAAASATAVVRQFRKKTIHILPNRGTVSRFWSKLRIC